jgi:amino acid adenylation domain-containing protein
MTLTSRLAAAASRFASRPALIIRGESFSYGHLDDLARRWARHIVDQLGKPAARVGVFGSRSLISYTGTMTALYAGATFVPLNPRFPAERTRRMIEMAELDFILVDRLASQQLASVMEGIASPPPVLTPELLEGLRNGPRLETLPEVSSSDLAYLLFTSGSTGLPKGVPITHGNARAYLDWGHARYGFTPEDRFSQTFDQTFDLSVHDQFLCWESGASLYSLSPPELLAPSRFIQKNGLTVWFSVPSIVAQMRKRNSLLPDSFPLLRWSLFCGEPLPAAAAEAWQAAAPHSTVENLYGPTELTIACAVHRWDPATSPDLCHNGIVPIGAPFPGLDALLLDENLQPLPAGQPGELAVSGPQTSPGYWQDPKRTAAAFIHLPQGRFYRTGDRVDSLPNGEYTYLGRIDHQVKVLGFRVELGEIEAVLRRNPAVVAAVAMGWPVIDGSAQGIVAFVQGENLDVPALLATAKASLSDYMVPAAIHCVDNMPLNANGKIDRAALLASLS